MARLILNQGESYGQLSGSSQIFGTVPGGETITLAGGTASLDASFNRGGDTVILVGNAATYSAQLSGSSVILTQTGTGISVTIPAGTVGASVQFADATRTLQIVNNQVLLGTQQITGTTAPVAPGTGGGGGTPGDFELTVTVGDVVEGTGNIIYRLELDSAPTSPITVNVSTGLGGDTATAGVDYVPVAQQVTFAAGQTVAFVTVTVNGDTVFEADESVTLNVSAPSNVSINPSSDQVALILNDDPDPDLIPRTTELTTGADTFTGSNVGDVINGSQNTTQPGKLLSSNDFIDGRGGIDTLILNNAPQGGNNTVLPNVLVDADLINVLSVEILQTNYNNVTLGTEASEAGLNTIVATLAQAGGFNLSILSAYTLSMTATLTSRLDTVATDLTQGADIINTGADLTIIDAVTVVAPTDVRLTFTSSEVGNGSAVESGTVAGQDGGLAIRMQREDGSDNLVGDVSRYDDEGIRFFNNNVTGFDVRDISGAQRGTFMEVVIGTMGGETLFANNGTSVYINAGQGNDSLFGTGGNDFLVGGGGADFMSGNAGNDTALGGAGDDTFNMGAGVDSANGGDGNDTYIYDDGQFVAEDIIADVDSDTTTVDNDTISITFSTNQIGDAQFANKTGIESFTASVQNAAGAEVTLAANAQAAGIVNVFLDDDDLDASAYTVGLNVTSGGNVITGTGSDVITLTGGQPSQVVTAGDGNDSVFGGTSVIDASDTLSGGAGTDTLTITDETSAGQTASSTFAFDGDFTGFEALVLSAGTEPVAIPGFADVAGSTNDYVVSLVNANVADGSTFTVDASALRTGVAVGLGAGGELGGGDDTFDSETLNFNGSALTGNRAVSVLGGAGADTILGGAGADVISGAGGIDVLGGGAGADTITGGAGNDLITGGAGADNLDGGTGNDDYIYGDGEFVAAEIVADTGGDAADEFIITSTSNLTDALFANKSGVEVLTTNVTNGGGTEVTIGANAQAAGILTVNAGDDDVNATGYTVGLTVTGSGVIDTGSGDDTIISTGNLSVNGGDGADSITLQGNGTQSVLGGAGNDTVFAAYYDFPNLSVNANTTLTGGAGTDTLVLSGFHFNHNDNVTIAFDADFTQFERIVVAAGLEPVSQAGPDVPGSTNDYALTLVDANVAAGTPFTVDASALRANVAVGLGGDGEIGGGDDTFDSETLSLFANSLTGNRAVSVIGGAAGDTVFGGAGADTINGGGGNDSLSGGNGADVIDGGDGNDTINGGGGADTLNGGAGNDTFNLAFEDFNNDADVIDGGTGTNTLVITSGNQNRIIADVGFNTRFTNITQVTLVGDPAGGPDTFTWTAGSFAQNAGVRTITIGDSAVGNISIANYTVGATLNGGAFNDTLTGSAQDDTISGGGGADSIVANSGNDTITVAGADTVDAGAGADLVTVTDAADISLSLGDGDDTVIGGAFITNADTLTGGAGTDVLRLGGPNVNIAFDGDFTGFEQIVALAGTAPVDNATGPDVAGTAFTYNLTLVGANVTDGSVFTVDASALRASVITGLGGDGVIGGGDDTTTAETLVLNGGALASNERLSVTGGAGGDTITGGAGADTISSGAGADQITGGAGNDSIVAGNGADTIVGGTGADAIDVSETTAARDQLIFGNLDSARVAFDIVTGFDIDDDDGVGPNAGLAATADTIDFGSAVLTGTNVSDGVVTGVLASNVQLQAGLLAAIQLVEQELQSQGALQSGTIAFEYQGSTYVAEVTNNGVDSDSETITDIVQLLGVTGVDALANAGGTSVGLIGG